MVVELSILLFSMATSGTWLFAARFSITQDTPIFTSISGDGSKIAFHSDVDGDCEIFVFNSDGTGLTQLTDNQATDRYASISGNGSKVACHSYDYVDGDCEIFVFNSDGTGLTQLTDNQATDAYPSISNDGSKITYTSDVNGDYEIFLVANGVATPLPMPETGFNFPIEYVAAGIVAIIVSVVVAIIFFVRKK
jgi:Tol biopolymer transport system component